MILSRIPAKADLYVMCVNVVRHFALLVRNHKATARDLSLIYQEEIEPFLPEFAYYRAFSVKLL